MRFTQIFFKALGTEARDPLFSYLFILAMEALSCLLMKNREGDFIFGFRVRRRDYKGVEMTHLVYAYSTVIFYETS